MLRDTVRVRSVLFGYWDPYTQTALHGTAIYAAPLTPLAPPQLIGSPMAVPWTVCDRDGDACVNRATCGPRAPTMLEFAPRSQARRGPVESTGEGSLGGRCNDTRLGVKAVTQEPDLPGVDPLESWNYG